jgi:formamidopyrimidine-DNA glycosylase
LIHQKLFDTDFFSAGFLIKIVSGCTLLIHLGMSGSLRVITDNTPATKHDHFDIIFAHDKRIRLTDPRRFGAVLWLGKDPESHPLISKLGPEPLSTEITAGFPSPPTKSRSVVPPCSIARASIF